MAREVSEIISWSNRKKTKTVYYFFLLSFGTLIRHSYVKIEVKLKFLNLFNNFENTVYVSKIDINYTDLDRWSVFYIPSSLRGEE